MVGVGEWWSALARTNPAINVVRRDAVPHDRLDDIAIVIGIAVV